MYYAQKILILIKKIWVLLVLVLFIILIAKQLDAQNYALAFNGSNNYVDCGNHSSLQMTTQITIEAWARYDRVEDDWSRIVTKGRWDSVEGADARDYGWMLAYTNHPDDTHTGLMFILELDGADIVLGTLTYNIIEEGVWYHISATYDGSEMKIYINGNEVATANHSGSLTETHGPYNVQIGRSYHYEEYFNGIIDEVRIWDTALTQSEIQAWLTKSLDNSHPHWSNLKGYWKFDDRIDPTNDYSDNNNLGYLEQGTSVPEFVINDDPLPVELSSFFVNFANGVSTISWITESEYNNLGWNIFRGQEYNALQNGNAIQVNSNMIQGNGTTSQSNEYHFDDTSDLLAGETYYYWIENIDFSGNSNFFGHVKLNIPNDDNEQNTPDSNQNYELSQNYPNPFNPSTTIKYYIPENGNVTVEVYDILGKKIKTLVNKIHRSGENSVLWDGTNERGNVVPSGVYIYKIKNRSYTSTKKMILLK